MDMRIQIRKSPTADTRTCDFTKVTKEQLKDSTEQHIADVGMLLRVFASELMLRAEQHDFTKLDHLDDFHRCFQGGFEDTSWYEMHKNTERHHVQTDGVIPKDVNLIDIVECVMDDIAAGMARAGAVRPGDFDPEVLENAVQNTIKQVSDKIDIVE